MGDDIQTSIVYLRHLSRNSPQRHRHHFGLVVNLIEAQQAEIERLRGWKAEATEVLLRWDAVADMVPARLGDRKSDAVAAEIERLRAALALAVGELSAHEHWGEFDHHEVVDHFLKEAHRG